MVFLGGLGLISIKLRRPPKDDPRLSKGLQLLQNKIAILEDLSDRTDAQVKQLSQLLEQKGRHVQEKIQLAEEHVKKVHETLEKSLEVSKIFETTIPHKEILERQNTNKYVQAARMANKGLTVEQISKKVDIPVSELEFIVKVNKEKLMFDDDQLPAWIDDLNSVEKDLSQAFEGPSSAAQESDARLKEEFKKAVEDKKAEEEKFKVGGFTLADDIQTFEPPQMNPGPVETVARNAASRITETAKTMTNAVAGSVKEAKRKIIKPYQFKKIGVEK